MISLSRVTLLTIGLWWSMIAGAASDAETTAVQARAADPKQLVESITNSVLSQIQGHKEEMRRDPHSIYALVETWVLPHFDFERMSRWVLGRYWNDATPAQQTRFVEEFRTLLVRTYGVALLDYTDEPIQFLPSRGDPAQGDVTVRTSIRHHGSTIVVESNMYRKDGAWKVYDVAIEGVSLVSNYRSSFANEIRNNGMDGLLAKLAAMNRSSAGKAG